MLSMRHSPIPTHTPITCQSHANHTPNSHNAHSLIQAVNGALKELMPRLKAVTMKTFAPGEALPFDHLIETVAQVPHGTLKESADATLEQERAAAQANLKEVQEEQKAISHTHPWVGTPPEMATHSCFPSHT